MAVFSEVYLSKLARGFRMDSEFYKQEYLAKDFILEKHICTTLGTLGKVTDGEHGSVNFFDEGVKYLTAENIKKGYVNIENIRYVSRDVDERNARSRVDTNDILVSIKGTLGQVALAEKWLLPANMNRDVAVIKLNSSDLYKAFVALFLQTQYGLYQLAREGSGGVQQMITLGRLREVKVPKLDEELQNKHARMYLQALSLKETAKKLYFQAQQMLDNELGLNSLLLEKANSYETRFSEIVSNHRLDANHYQPQYKQIKSLVMNYKNKYLPLQSLVEIVRPNFNPKKEPLNDFMYIELSNIDSVLGIIDEHKYVTGITAPSRARRRVTTGDILVSAVVGSIDKAGIVDKSKDGALASTGFFHFRSKGYSAFYLLLLLRSKIVQMQFLQEATGGILSAVPDKNLKKIIVPNIDEEKINILDELVQSSHKAYFESKQLLEHAKRKVEGAIEGVIKK